MKNALFNNIWEALNEIPDPEIPPVSLVELGIIRDVIATPEGVIKVVMTPTFSGCPALHRMKDDIRSKLTKMNLGDVEIETVLYPPWTTDWINQTGRNKLKKFGLAPPPIHGGNFIKLLLDPVPCPFCDSENTRLTNNWGSTLCRMIYFCDNCRQPFEQFKPL